MVTEDGPHRGFIKSVHHGDGGDMFETEGSQS